MPIIRGQFSDYFLDTMLPALNERIRQTYRKKPQQFRKLFRVEDSDKGIEQFSEISGLGLFTEINELGEARMDFPVQGFDKTFKHKRFGLGFEVSQDVAEDRPRMARDMAIELGNSANETQEIQAATVFNNAFTAAAYAGPDAVALCSASHPQVKVGGTQSNILTAAADLDVSSMELALIDWELLEKPNGHQMSLPTPNLLVAPQNRWNAYTIAKAGQRSETAHNTVNAFDGGGENGSAIGQVIVWPKLTDTDAWFLVAPPESTGLLWFWRRRPYQKGGFDDKTEKGYTIMRYKCSYGFKNYLGVFGTPGV